MPQPSLHQSPLKEGRLILSEKDTNACLSPALSPAKQTRLNSLSPKKLLPSPSFTGQKRSISQVDAEDAELRVPVQAQRVEERPAHHGTSIESTSTSTSNAMNLDVPEQTSRRSQQQPLYKTDSTQNPAQFASKEPKLDSTTSSSQTVPSDPGTRKLFIQEKASLLRNRLQNAMRHVRDPEIDRRVSELEEHSRKYPRLSGSGSGSGAQLQKHLEQKYGTDGAEQEAKNEGKDDDEPMLFTPRAPGQNQSREEQQEIIRIPDDEDEETTPTQDNAAQRTGVDMNNRAASPTQMLLSSPTYNSTVQTGRFDDDRPCAREGTVATSPSSSQQGGSRGDGDAVDGLLKLMGRNTGPATTTA